ncbi:hypothetical protein HYV22_03215 [Candidatus Gottesmanbacteria bacterium]|nr:hypothetical protein [Candidatus Gottesmanbacteria bacterium]
MDLSGPGITYVFLIIPTIFALVVVGQGMVKITKKEGDGPIIALVGCGFLGLIALAYFFFIR